MQLTTTGHESGYGSTGHELGDEIGKKRTSSYNLNDSMTGMNNYYDYTDMTTNQYVLIWTHLLVCQAQKLTLSFSKHSHAIKFFPSHFACNTSTRKQQ